MYMSYAILLSAFAFPTVVRTDVAYTLCIANTVSCQWQTRCIICVSFAARKQDLGIAGFGISMTTMEEVFIKVGQGTEETLERKCVLYNVYMCNTFM